MFCQNFAVVCAFFVFCCFFEGFYNFAILGGSLRAPWANGCQTCLKLFLMLLMLFRLPLFVVQCSMSFSILFRNLLVSMLSSQADPPTIKNLDFGAGFCYFDNNQCLPYREALASVRGLFGAHFWRSWGALAGYLNALGALDGSPKF